MVTYQAYDVKAKKKVNIKNPKATKLKNGVWAIKGESSATGNKVFRIVGKTKPTVYPTISYRSLCFLFYGQQKT